MPIRKFHQCPALLVIIVSIMAYLGTANRSCAGDIPPPTDSKSLWFPDDEMASGDYQNAISIIDTIAAGSYLRLISFQLPGSGRTEFRLSDIFHLQKGYAYYSMGKFDRAVYSLREVDDRDILLRELRLVLLVRSFMGINAYSSAGANASIYIAEFPNGMFYGEMLGIKAEKEYSMGLYRQAGELFHSAAECAYDSEVVSRLYLRASESFKLAGDIRDCYDNYYLASQKTDRLALRDSLYKIFPNDDAAFARKMGYHMYNRRLFRTTIRYLNEAPKDDSLIFLEGLCRQRIGHYRTARHLFKSINNNSPFSDKLLPGAKFHAAISAYLSKSHKTAIRELKQFIEQYADHPLSADALEFLELIKANYGKKPQEILEYLFNTRASDRNYGLRETTLMNKAWRSFKNGDYVEACSLFITLQMSNEKNNGWNEGYYWALRSALPLKDEIRIKELKNLLAESNGNRFYPAVAEIVPGLNLIKSGGNVPDSIEMRAVIELFFEKWNYLNNKISRAGQIDYTDYKSISLYGLTVDVGFEELSQSLFNKIIQSDILTVPDVILLLNYLLEKQRFDEFYQLIYTKKTDLETIADAEFLLYPPLFYSEVLSGSAAAGVDPFLVWAIIKNESRFDSDVQSYAGAIGLMQLMPRTARRTAGKMRLRIRNNRELENPSMNIRIGAVYLADLIRRYNGNLIRALAAYNAGPGNLRKWLRKSGKYSDPYFLDRFAFSQTRHYVKAVLNDYLHYRQLWHNDYDG